MTTLMSRIIMRTATTVTIMDTGMDTITMPPPISACGSGSARF